MSPFFRCPQEKQQRKADGIGNAGVIYFFVLALNPWTQNKVLIEVWVGVEEAKARQVLYARSKFYMQFTWTLFH